MNTEEIAFKDRKTLANLNKLDLLDIIELLQVDRREWINQFSKTHNESIEIQKENQELKEKVKKLSQWDNNKDSRNSRQRVANAKLIKENQKLKKQVEENKDNYNCLLKQKEQFEYIMSKQVDYQGQQKEFMKYLEDEIKLHENDIQNFKKDYKVYFSLINDLRVSKAKIEEILQKYKEIIGVSNDY